MAAVPRDDRARSQTIPARPERALSSGSYSISEDRTSEPMTDVSRPSREDLATLARLEPAENEDVKRYSTVDGWVGSEFRADGSSRLISLISSDDARAHTLSQSFSSAVGGSSGEAPPMGAARSSVGREDSTERSTPAASDLIDTLPGGVFLEDFSTDGPASVTDGRGERRPEEETSTAGRPAARSNAPGGVRLSWASVSLIALICMAIGSLLTLLLNPN